MSNSKTKSILNEDVLQTIKNTLNQIRWSNGEHTPFVCLYQFFADLLTNPEYNVYKYILFKTRRSFVLFEMFVEMFEHEYENRNQNSELSFRELYANILDKVYNDSVIGGIDFNETYVENEKHLLIVDDILIHGRTLSTLVDSFKGIAVKDKKVQVFLKNSSANCISSDLKEILSFQYEYGDAEWESVSNAFVIAIQQSGISYSSFAPQYIVRETVEGALGGFFKLEPETNEVTSLSGMKSTFYYPSNAQSSNTHIHKLIRKYSCQNKDILVPFVILPSFSITVWEQHFEQFCNKLKQEQLIDDNDYNYLMHISKSSIAQKHVFSYKLVTYILSELYFYSVIKELYKNVESKNYFLYSTFGKEIAKIINNIVNNYKKANIVTPTLYQDFEDLFNNDETLLLDYNSILPDERNVFPYIQRGYNQAPNPNTVVRNYISRLNALNEQNAKNDNTFAPRFYGFDMAYMCEFLYSNDYKKQYELISAFVSRWDNGKSSFTPIQTDNLIIGCVADGEQAYHEILGLDCMDAINCFYAFLRFENNVWHKAVDQYERFVQYCIKRSNSHVDKLETVLTYVKSKNNIGGLKNLYIDQGIKNDLINIFIEYQKGGRAE